MERKIRILKTICTPIHLDNGDNLPGTYIEGEVYSADVLANNRMACLNNPKGGYSHLLNDQFEVVDDDEVSNDDMKVKKIQEKEISLEEYINAQILVNKYLIQYLSRHE